MLQRNAAIRSLKGACVPGRSAGQVRNDSVGVSELVGKQARAVLHFNGQLSELLPLPGGESRVAFGIHVSGVAAVGSRVPGAFPATAGTAPAPAHATISRLARKLTIAHAHRRIAPPAAGVRSESGRSGKHTVHGAAASAAPRGSAGTKGNTCFFSCGACRPGNGVAETNAAASAPFALGVADAHARLRAGMAECEEDGTGRRQNLV